MRKRWLILIVIIIVAVIIAFKWHNSGGTGQGFQMPPTLVDVAVAKQQQWQQQIQAVGNLNADQGVMVNPEVGGVITKIFFKSGEYVAQNAPLIQLNPAVIQAQLNAAQAQLVLSQKQYQRYATLYAQKAASKSNLDTAEATMDSDQADVEKAQAQLQQTLVRAPFSGKLGLKLIDLGQYLSPGEPIVNLQDVDNMRVDFQVPEVYLQKLQLGQKVWVTSPAYGDQVFEGVVDAFDSAVNQSNLSLGLRARVPNPQHVLVPGTFVNVSLFIGDNKPVVTIPQIAVMYAVGSEYVFKVVNNKAVQTPIILGETLGNDVAVTSGLNPGDIVIVGGQIKVADGSPVVVRNSSDVSSATVTATTSNSANNADETSKTANVVTVKK